MTTAPDFAAMAAELAPCVWPCPGSGDLYHSGSCPAIRRPAITTALQSAYNAGAEDMREDAAMECDSDVYIQAKILANMIRALPIPAPDKKVG